MEKSWYGGIKNCKMLLIFSLFLLLIMPAAGHPQEFGGIYCLKGGTVVKGTGEIIEDGIVVIRDGLIESVGKWVDVPPDAEIIDVSSLYIYPGLIDAHTTLAIPKKKEGEEEQNGGQSREPEPLFTPEKKAYELIQADDKGLKKVVESGITTALTVNPTGVFPGVSSLINLQGENTGEMVIKPVIAQHITGATGRNQYPSTLMAAVAFKEQTFLDLQHYLEMKRLSGITQRGWKRYEFNPSLEALEPVLKKSMPVVIDGMKENDIIRAVKLAEKFGLNYMISGAVEGYRTVELLRKEGKPVLLSLDFPKPEQVTGYSYALKVDLPEKEEKPSKEKAKEEEKGQDEKKKKEEKEDQEFWDLIYGNAASLYEAGIKFAFCSYPEGKPEKLLENVKKTVENGLPEEEALKALTVNAAEIFGVKEQLGTIEIGKIANLVVSDGKLLEEKSKLKYVFVDGKKIEIEEKKKKKEEAVEGEVLDVSGTWEMEIVTPDGVMSATLSLKQSGNSLTGSWSSDMGYADLEDGHITGNEIEFRIYVGGIDAAFTGTVEDDEISGSVDAGPMGTASWKATKGPGF